MIVEWTTRCQHCGHHMASHGLDWEFMEESDCIEFDCVCPGFEPRKEPDDEG